ncbi:MAG: hypothetical protein E7543_08190 [Ruminococcaceae bacterium]|nr:hypothetical protein [Oscillospiraceae bacterium]
MKYAVILLRYIRGYVRVCASGGFPERFLNLCYSQGISLWDVCLHGDKLTFCVSRDRFIRLRNPAKKSGVKITLLQKNGLIYKYRKYNKRAGLAVGTLMFLSIHLILSMFVWCVDVKGNSDISKSEIINLAADYGLAPGTLKKGFDEIRAARNIAADYGGKITWLSVNIKGSLAVIELREDDRIISDTRDDSPCNIIADFDGVILSAETFYGDCTVKRGIGVKKGDLLISGAIVNEDMSTTFYAAKGRLTALHEAEIRFTESINEAAEKLIKSQEGYVIGFFGTEIPVGSLKMQENDTLFTERKTLSINGLRLPFYIEKKTAYTAEKAAEENHSVHSMEKMQHGIYVSHSNSTVTEKNEEIQSRENSLILIGKYTLIDFIGEEKPILSDE